MLISIGIGWHIERKRADKSAFKELNYYHSQPMSM